VANLVSGVLLSKAKLDKNLSDYAVIVINEAHQHTAQTDILLALLKRLLQTTRSKDLKVIIMSATIDAKLFNDYYPGSKVELVEGRQHKVQEFFLLTPSTDVISDTITMALQCALRERLGNILIFAPGIPEINKVLSGLQRRLERDFSEGDICPIKCYSLHAKMSNAEQDEVVNSVPPTINGRIGRKLIVATNVAEASITINDIAIVIDMGLANSNVYDSEYDCWRFFTSHISKTQKKQRVGRAGRQKQGMAILMYTEGGYHRDMLEYPVAAMKQIDMVVECITILAIGENPLNFPYITPPATETVNKALAQLYHLLAIDGNGELTGHGRALGLLPVDPYLAEIILCSQEYGCSDEIVLIVAMIEATDGGTMMQIMDTQEDKKVAPQKLRPLRHPRGDHLTYLNVYMAWRSARIASTEREFCAEHALRMSVLQTADRTRKELIIRLHQTKVPLISQDPTDLEYYVNIVKALAAGNYLKVAKRNDAKGGTHYITMRAGREVELYPSVQLGGNSGDTEFVLYNKHVAIKGQPDRLRLVTSVRPEWLIATRPDYWWNVEHMTPGEGTDRIVSVMAGMTGLSEAYLRGGMPPVPAPRARPAR
jgi:pre-mRNA-splicing factor ATP-dependent RNA helicase DHX15/PRP43